MALIYRSMNINGINQIDYINCHEMCNQWSNFNIFTVLKHAKNELIGKNHCIANDNRLTKFSAREFARKLSQSDLIPRNEMRN